MDSLEEIRSDVAAVQRVAVIPKLLQILCSVTGMGFAAVGRVSDSTWTACAVKDDINFGLLPGGQLDVHTTLCIEVKAGGTPIVVDHASQDPRYCGHHTPQLYKIESYISVPIVLKSGRYFGNLCAIDQAPAVVSDPRIVTMFEGFSDLIATQLESEFQHQRDRDDLRDAHVRSELREQFIAILGHDLRNPLQSILAAGEVLERKFKDNPSVSQTGQRIKRSAKRMSALIDDVLDFARGGLGDGIGVQVKEVHDIEAAVTAVVEELQDGAPQRLIELEANVPGSVHCDVARFQQVASNLIGNALTHGAPNSPVKVSVSVEQDQLVLKVWNDGDPIPSEALNKVFDPFWRRETSTDRQGLGLGLHISSQIVRAHGGELSVRSAKETGTSFTARLPVRPG